MGWSRPTRLMNASHTAAVARSPSAARHGSPGSTRARAKVTNTIPKSTGIAIKSLRTTKLIIFCPQVIQVTGTSKSAGHLGTLFQPDYFLGAFLNAPNSEEK